MVNLDELRELVDDRNMGYEEWETAIRAAMPALLAELQAAQAVVTAATDALWEDPGNASHDRLDVALAAYDKAVRNE
jgi:hypothetical protein